MEQPQLRMIHRLGQVPETRALADGYRLRKASLLDAEPLGGLLGAAFGDRWDVDRVNEVLLVNRDVATTWVVETYEGEIVATASYQLMPERFPFSGWVHYVAADANHGGKGLGRVVTVQVVVEAAAAGKRDIRLTTDDFRLAAIQTYLNLGFEPDMWHESHPGRWAAILQELGHS